MTNSANRLVPTMHTTWWSAEQGARSRLTLSVGQPDRSPRRPPEGSEQHNGHRQRHRADGLVAEPLRDATSGLGGGWPQPVTPPRPWGSRVWKSTIPTQVGRTAMRAILVPG
jgi:hypothetical protein